MTDREQEFLLGLKQNSFSILRNFKKKNQITIPSKALCIRNLNKPYGSMNAFKKYISYDMIGSEKIRKKNIKIYLLESMCFS